MRPVHAARRTHSACRWTPALGARDERASTRGGCRRRHLCARVSARPATAGRFDVQAFASAEAFLAADVADATDCLVLDVGLPGLSGPDLQQELARRGKRVPIVFITAKADQSLQPRLLAAGAVACLFKPFNDTALIEAVEAALR